MSWFKFIDESYVNTSLTRLSARTAPDMRVVDDTPQPSGARPTTLDLMGLDGISAPLVSAGPINGIVFARYLQQSVVPSLQPGDILVMDNLSAH